MGGQGNEAGDEKLWSRVGLLGILESLRLFLTKKGIERDLSRAPDFSQGCGHTAGAQHDVRLT